MCGIAGFCDFTKKTDKQTLVNMTDILIIEDQTIVVIVFMKMNFHI